MAVKNFVFRKNWVGSEVASMKIAFFPSFDPTNLDPHFGTNRPNMGFLKQNFNFQPLRKTEANIITSYVTLALTNLGLRKNLENNSFLLFLTQSGRKKSSPNFLQICYFLLF